MTLFILVALFIVLIAAGMPIAFAIGVASFGALLSQGLPVAIISHYMFAGVDSFVLCAIPMFILAGEIMLQGGLTKALTDLADVLVGRIRGGLGHTNIMASIFFAGITGSATADTTAIGSILIPTMKSKGYGAAYSTAVTIAGAIIGPIIPPSLTFIIYSLAVGNLSIGAMFLAGIVPGLAVGFALMGIHYYVSKKRNYEKRTTAYTWGEIFTIVRRSLVVAVMPGLIVVGISTGAFTATESAAAAAGYAFVICFLILRTIKFEALWNMLLNTAKISSIMFLLLATSNLFSYVLTIENVPVRVADAIHAVTQNKYVFLFLVNILLLMVGCVVDLFPAILIFAPILAPIAVSYGVDPLHFGIIFCVNLLIGLNTPPVGSGLFIGAALGGVSMEELVVEVMRFNAVQILVLMALTYIPFVTLAVPRLLGF